MKYFLFDIGKVLVDFELEEFFRLHADAAGKPLPPFSENDVEKRDALECGLISDADWVDYLNETRGLGWSEADLVATWSRMFSLNEVGCGLFKTARQADGVSVHTLSNIAKHNMDAIEANWNGFFDGMDSLFLSYKIGSRKPHPEIYRHVLGQLGAAGEQCFFVDDLAENIETARELGIHAYQFIPENHDTIRAAANAFFKWV
ncbi:MAG: HAD-IA family hydrolase [Verrucomicrobiota bacterium]